MEIFDFLMNIIIHFIDWLPTLPVDSVFAAVGLKQVALEYAENAISTCGDYFGLIGKTMMSVFGGGSAFSANLDAKIEGAIKVLMGPMQGVGVVIAAALWIFNIIELAIQDRLTPETLIKSLSRLAISALAIDLAPQLFDLIKEFGNALMNDVLIAQWQAESDAVSSLQAAWTEAQPDLDGMTYIAVMLEATAILIPCELVALVLVCVVYVVAISRMLEINIRGVFLPIAIGMLADDGWKGAGGRYIRKFIAVVAQGAVLVAIGAVVNVVMDAALTMTTDVTIPGSGGMGSIMGVLLLITAAGIASVALMFKAIGIANDVFGG